MNYCELRGMNEASWTSFDAIVSISEYEENFNVLDGPLTGRVKTGRMLRDIIGCYVGHKITFRASGMSPSAVASFDALWTWLKKHSVDDYIHIKAADNQTVINYEAYYTSGTRKLRSVQNGVNYWEEIAINFIPMEATITP